jgi:E3 Ubiquitin ligase
VHPLSHPPPYALIALAAAALALLALWRFLARLRRDRLVADTPHVRIRSAAQGYVKVQGRAQPAGPAPTPAPLSGLPCVWWSYEIAHEERDSKGNRRWQTTDSRSSVEPFALTDDDEARCLVGPVKAEITPTVRHVWYGATSWPMTGPPDDSGMGMLLRLGSWRYTERLLSVGARVCVLGEFRSHSEVGDLNAATTAKLHEWKQDQQALLARFDLDHDGKLSDAEWQAAREAAARESQTQALESSISRESVIAEPVNGEPFLIAPLTDTALERREKLYAGLYLALGLIGVVVCAWAIRHGTY